VSVFFVLALVVFSTLRISAMQSAGPSAAGDVGSLPADDFNTRYVQNPVIAYLHIVPGVVYVVLAPFQLARSLRRRQPEVHRTVGRVAAGAGLLSAVFAVVFGLFLPWGGLAEATAALVFGAYMGVALVLGVRAARRRDLTRHRQWMIRAFAVSLGVATIRVLLALGEEFDVVAFDDAFGVAFWVGLAINAAIAEWWLRMRPQVNGSRRVRPLAVPGP
jgi:uncharacterized membrane protein YozB (DUF420 family)